MFQIGQKVTINADRTVNMRSGPGTEFPIIASPNPGDAVVIIAGPHPTATYIWWQVRWMSPTGKVIEGWLADFLLAPSP
jgi:uncharacterized protein YraI